MTLEKETNHLFQLFLDINRISLSLYLPRAQSTLSISYRRDFDLELLSINYSRSSRSLLLYW